MARDCLVPVKGACVKRREDGVDGRVKGARHNESGVELQVLWRGNTGQNEWVSLESVRSGVLIGMEVMDMPNSRTRKSLGEGVVLETRTIGKCDQALVEFYESGKRFWLPYENLRQIKGPQHRFILGKFGDNTSAERFRLRSLAHALEMWHENTGSLSRMEIDPLPHQINLVHHILASGNLNWLIADDVGLGKTIEVGMLLAALERRGTFRRILLVTPAGLVRQWQEELHHKFGMSDFQIYGQDFEVNDSRHWKLHDHVIGSIDRFKSQKHLENLLRAGSWDLIVFDEAHRLSRRQWGRKYEASERFKLAATLRQATDAMIQLSATPHQGMQDKFQALLELLRPELKTEIETLTLNPQILRDMVIRNHKADVTDVEGNFIFKGKLTRAVQVPIGEEERQFDAALQRYLREGYESSRQKGRTGAAIGFVMTTYRKLAASSIAAILASLKRRMDRLRGERIERLRQEEEDERYAGEMEERELFRTQETADEFFDGEMQMLKDLAKVGELVAREDRKLRGFIEELVSGIHRQAPREKVLIFTEYRSTQAYLAEELVKVFGGGSVYLINGSMDYAQREQSIVDFEERGLFLISTEAGGEGLNLHRRCHIMVNYDLPWNPMRLVQRIGRLYRYGQTKKVVVINMHAPQTVDAQIMGMMYSRISQVVADMAPVGEEFRSGLEDEILGELAEMLDIEDILEEASEAGISRTQERIDEALRRAREALERQRELFEYVTGYDPNEAKGEIAIGGAHLHSFVEGMFREMGIEIVDRTYQGAVLDIKIPGELGNEIPGVRQRMRVTTNRDIAVLNRTIHVMDFDSPLFCYLVEKAKSYGFDGISAKLTRIEGQAVVTAMLRWQNDQGTRMRQEYTALIVPEKGRVQVNPQKFTDWLLAPTLDGEYVGGKEQGKALIERAIEAMDNRLSELSSAYLHPENLEFINAGWVTVDR